MAIHRARRPHTKRERERESMSFESKSLSTPTASAQVGAMSSTSSGKRRSTAEVEDAVYPLEQLQQLSQSLWMVKVPAFIAEQWESAPEDQALGHFFTRKNNKTQKREFVVKLDHEWDKRRRLSASNDSLPPPAVLPTDMIIDEIPRAKNEIDSESIFAFTSDAKQQKFAVEGHVTKKFVMRCESNEQLSRILRHRQMTELSKRTTVEVKEIDPLQQQENFARTIDLSVNDSRRAMRSRALASGMAHLPHEDAIRQRILQAFRQTEYLKMDDLYSACQGIEGFHDRNELKAVLENFAYFNRQGPQRGHYELKSEYKLED